MILSERWLADGYKRPPSPQVYFLVGFHREAHHFFVFTGFMCLCSTAATSLALMVSALARSAPALLFYRCCFIWFFVSQFFFWFVPCTVLLLGRHSFHHSHFGLFLPLPQHRRSVSYYVL